MNEDRHYILEFLWIWVKALIFYYIGGFIFGVLSIGGSGSLDKQAGIALALIVFGSAFFNKVVPFNLFGNSSAVFIFWAIKLVVCLIVGIIAFPIVNLYYVINIIISIVKKAKNA